MQEMKEIRQQLLTGERALFGSRNLRIVDSVFDAGATYEPSWAKGWRLSLVVDNLLDRRYCDFAGWSDFSGAYCYPAAGRSILATLSCEF